MHTMAAFCMLVAVGLLLLPAPTSATECPEGQVWTCSSGWCYCGRFLPLPPSGGVATAAGNLWPR